MRSGVPKMLCDLCGRPLLRYVLDVLRAVDARETIVVVGEDGAAIREGLDDDALRFVVQQVPRGTGDALLQARSAASGGTLLIVPGDLPLLSPASLCDAVGAHRASGNDLTVLATRAEEPAAYGRLVCDDMGLPLRVVEAADATEEQLAIREVNSGIYVASNIPELWEALADLTTDNAQGELYVTDVVAAYRRRGRTVGAFFLEPAIRAMGVNTRADLAQAAQFLYRESAERLMESGVTLLDPERTYVDPGVSVGRDSILFPDTHVRGSSSIGPECSIGPGAWIEDSAIGGNCQVRYAVLESATVHDGCHIGPFAHLRPGADAGPGCRIGNFVEVKASRLEAGVKAGHLAYLGDAHIGEGTNIGAGAITCNYDGKDKHPTAIGKRAFIGSNVSLIAPVTIGEDAFVAAGSTITEDVAAGETAFARARQVNRARLGEPEEGTDG